MRIRRLDIRRMPGFKDAGFVLPDLADGLNLVIGPNASGKTTTCRAIRGLLWPETLEGLAPVSLAGLWADGEHTWQLEVEGAKASCQRDGAPADRPVLPAPHLARCFTITVDDLFEDTQTDDDLAAGVAREMAGGYDLGAIHELPMLALRSKHGQNERKDLRAAEQAVKDIQARLETLAGQEQELAGLESRAAQALAAQTRRQRVADVLALQAVGRQAAAAAESLQSFGPAMDCLSGKEAAELADIRNDLRGEQNALDAADAEIEQARRLLAQADLPAGGIPETRLRELKAHLDALRQAEAELRGLDKQLADAEAKLQAAGRAAGGASAAAAPDAATLAEIEAFHRDAQAHAGKLAGVEGRLQALGNDAAPAADIGTLIGGVGVLQEWLDAGGQGVPPRKPLAHPLLALALVLGVVVGAMLLTPWALMGLLVVGALVLLADRPAAQASSDRRQGYQEQYSRLGLEMPAAWEREAVLKRLAALRQAQAAEQVRQERAQERKARQADLEQLRQEGAALEQRRRGLREKTGLAMEAGDLAMVVLAGTLKAYREAAEFREGLAGQRAHWAQRRGQALEAVNAVFAEFGLGPCEAFDVAQVRGEELSARADKQQRGAEKLSQAERAARAAAGKIDALGQKKCRLFEQAGLDDDADAELSRRVALLGEYRKAAGQARDLEAQERMLAANLDDAPDLKAMTPEQARAEAERLDALVNEYAPLVERATDIRNRVAAARASSELEDALAAADGARGRLARRREEAELAAAGRMLIEQVETQHKVQSQPEVFRLAARWFAQFTRGRYELRIDDAAAGRVPAFRAVDSASGAGLALGQLSRGTRMQLLLAVRLAFAARAEGGTELPFILDEVLSSTDPLRYRAVTECLLALVKDGRQVFYFTCQPGDAAAWRDIALEMGISAARRIDLAEVRRLEGGSSSLLDASAARVEPVPEPAGRSLSEYARLLGVPPLAPASGADPNHLAHFVETPEQLYPLLRAGIETYGQLRLMAAHGPVGAYVADDLLARVSARGALVDAFAEGWRIGRGRPLSREALADAGVSGSFIDRLCELAADLSWDAKRFLLALESRSDDRTKGFRASQVEPIREALVDAGFLDMADPLGKPALQARVLAAVNASVLSGALDPADARAFFEGLWSLATA